MYPSNQQKKVNFLAPKKWCMLKMNFFSTKEMVIHHFHINNNGV